MIYVLKNIATAVIWSAILALLVAGCASVKYNRPVSQYKDSAMLIVKNNHCAMNHRKKIDTIMIADDRGIIGRLKCGVKGGKIRIPAGDVKLIIDWSQTMYRTMEANKVFRYNKTLQLHASPGRNYYIRAGAPDFPSVH